MITETKSNLLFINELCESRSFTSSKSIDSLNYEKLSGYAYLSMVALLLLSKLNQPEASRYARKTSAFNNFDKMRLTVNDLYVVVYTLLGHNENYRYQDKVEEKSFLSELDVKRFLAVVASDASGETFMPSYFYGLERQLRMTNGLFRNLRRSVIYWDYKSEKEQQKIVADLVYNLQKISFNSDIKELLRRNYDV